MNSNAANGGLVLKALNKLYLTDIHHFSGTAVLDLDSGECSRVDGIWWFMNLDYPYIYYSDQHRGNALYRYHVSSQAVERLRDEPCYGLTRHKEWLYYIHDDDRKLYRCQLNGARLSRLTDESVTSFVIHEDCIYYSTIMGIRMGDLEGFRSELISDQVALHMVMLGEKVAFSAKNNNGMLTLLDLNTRSTRSFDELSSLGLNTDGKYLYCSNELNGRTLYRVDFERNNWIRICGELVDYIHIVEDHIYFWGGKEWNRISLHGGQPVIVSAYVRG
ncbi:DUF5050 domain-containing protein [Paenibacillus marinisediminis]